MVIHEYRDSGLPKIVLLHPMMADARCMLRLTESMEGKYCAIIPDLSGQGEDSGEYGNARQEAETLTLYLKKKGYTELALLMGASLGGLVGMYLLGQGEISCKTAVFEGVPLYENAWLIYKFMKFGFLKKHRKAVQMPLAEVKKSMSARYGVFGDMMAENFVKMSEKSLINVVRDCSDFPFPPLPEAVQRRIFLEVGSKDINCRQNKTIWKHYPASISGCGRATDIVCTCLSTMQNMETAGALHERGAQKCLKRRQNHRRRPCPGSTGARKSSSP